MPEEADYYLEPQVREIKRSPMWNQSPENPLQLTPIQQLEWFELLAREETVRLLQDKLRPYCTDQLALPLRTVPEGWNQVLARLPQRLANFTEYHLTDLNKTVYPSKPGIPEGDFWVYVGHDGRSAVETIIELFLKEADAELFPVPGKSASAASAPAPAPEADRIERSTDSSTVRADAVQDVLDELAKIAPLMKSSADYDGARKQFPDSMIFKVCDGHPDLKLKLENIAGHQQRVRFSLEIVAANYGRKFNTVQKDWKNHKPRKEKAHGSSGRPGRTRIVRK